MADSFNVTPGSGIQLATREVDSKHYQKVSGDLIYFEGTNYLNSGTSAGSNPTLDAAAQTATGRLLTNLITLNNVSLEANGGNGNDNGLVEIVDIDVITPIRFFDNNTTSTTASVDINNCRLGVMLLNGVESGNTLTTGSAVSITNAQINQILSILTLYPVHTNKIGGVYNYTFQVRSGRHRSFISTTGRSNKNVKAAFILHSGSQGWQTTETNNNHKLIIDGTPANNKLAWRFTFDRTMI